MEEKPVIRINPVTNVVEKAIQWVTVELNELEQEAEAAAKMLAEATHHHEAMQNALAEAKRVMSTLPEAIPTGEPVAPPAIPVAEAPSF